MHLVFMHRIQPYELLVHEGVCVCVTNMTFWLCRFRYPIVVFHRGDVERSNAQEILSQYLRGDQLQLIELHRAEYINEFPPGLDPQVS